MSQVHPLTMRLADWSLRALTATRPGHLLLTQSISRWLTSRSYRKIRRTPDALGLTWEPASLLTEDRYRLQGWIVTPPRPRGTVALFHGIRHNREQTLTRTALLVEAGYRCVAFDHRAHGDSQGRRSSFGYHEGRDVAAVLQLIRARWPHQPHAALGMSMGAAALCYAAAHTRFCHAVILESVYQDIVSAWLNRLKGRPHPPILRALTPDLVKVCEWLLEATVDQLSPINWIADLAPAPLLLLTGTDDAHAPPAEAERMFNRRQGPGELYLVPGAGHGNVLEVGGAPYRERLLSFLERWLFQASPNLAA